VTDRGSRDWWVLCGNCEGSVLSGARQGDWCDACFDAKAEELAAIAMDGTAAYMEEQQ